MESFKIIALCVGAAATYGVLHDQVTAHLCVEYFTVGHPPVFATRNPTLLAIGWGVIATWWVGLGLGVPLAVAAKLGSRPEVNAASLIRPIVLLIATTATCAVLAGASAWMLTQAGLIDVPQWIVKVFPVEKRVPFLVDWWAHSTSYTVGSVGGVVLIAYVWWSRRRISTGRTERLQATATTRPIGAIEKARVRGRA